jgi:hypothetical protein
MSIDSPDFQTKIAKLVGAWFSTKGIKLRCPLCATKKLTTGVICTLSVQESEAEVQVLPLQCTNCAWVGLVAAKPLLEALGEENPLEL